MVILACGKICLALPFDEAGSKLGAFPVCHLDRLNDLLWCLQFSINRHPKLLNGNVFLPHLVSDDPRKARGGLLFLFRESEATVGPLICRYLNL